MKNMHKLKEFKYLLNIYIFSSCTRYYCHGIFKNVSFAVYFIYFFVFSVFLSNFNEHPNYKEKLDLSYKLNEI